MIGVSEVVICHPLDMNGIPFPKTRKPEKCSNSKAQEKRGKLLQEQPRRLKLNGLEDEETEYNRRQNQRRWIVRQHDARIRNRRKNEKAASPLPRMLSERINRSQQKSETQGFRERVANVKVDVKIRTRQVGHSPNPSGSLAEKQTTK